MEGSSPTKKFHGGQDRPPNYFKSVPTGNANHLMNFRMPERTATPNAHPPPRRKSYQYVAPFKKERFVHANYRFVVSSHGSYKNLLADPDAAVDWENIEQVRMFSHSDYECPICLHPPIAPKIPKCGHVFCWPCILQHLSYGSAKCPICGSFIRAADLCSVHIDVAPRYAEGNTVQFKLMKRTKSSVISLPRENWLRHSEEQPQLSDPDAVTHARLLVTDDISGILSSERGQLNQAAAEATADDNQEVLLYVMNAQEQLTERERRADSNKELTSALLAISQPSLPRSSSSSLANSSTSNLSMSSSGQAAVTPATTTAHVPASDSEVSEDEYYSSQYQSHSESDSERLTREELQAAATTLRNSRKKKPHERTDEE